MTRVAVVGGTGTVGRAVVDALLQRGHDVRVLSRRPPEVPAAEHRAVDVTTGAGLDVALAGVDVVVDAANAMSMGKQAKAVLLTGTKHLLAAEQAAGVGHHVLISIVGIDDVPLPYYRMKVEQEALVTAGRTPWTVVRATQFHTLLDQLFTSAARAGLSPRSGFPLQPVDPGEVGELLAEVAVAADAEARHEMAGPEVRPLAELARAWAAARGRRRLPLPVRIPGRIGRGLRAGGLTSATARRGTVTFDAWLRAQAAP